ncbi:fasciclin domain-containing protein [soil metagenome]
MTSKMMRGVCTAALLSTALLASGCAMGNMGMKGDAMAQDSMMASDATVMVGGAAMYPTKTIVENAVNSPIHHTLVAAVTAAGLVDTLNGPGPFTVFAPTDAAFAKLPAGTVDTLVMPANKATLTKILTYHVVAGRLSAADIAGRIRAGHGSARLTTVEGGVLTASMRGMSVILTDEKGGVSTITQADVFQSNGVIHVTDTVSMPN